ncbi:hypothetical protein Tco_1102833, partial [Tanacetum coccineum]
DHAFEVEPLRNVSQGAGPHKVQTQDLIYYHSVRDREQHSACVGQGAEDSNEAAFAVAEAKNIYAHELLTFNNTVACEVISKWKAGLKDDMDARSDVYVLSNGCTKCSDDSDDYYWEYTPGECDVEKNGKWSCIYAVRSQEYQLVCTRLDIASADVAMMLHMMALSTTEAAYMTLTEAAKEDTLLKGLAIESGFELKIVEGIATSALSKAIPCPSLVGVVLDSWFRFRNRFVGFLGVQVRERQGGSRRTIIESEIEMITEEVEDDSSIIYDKDARSKVRSFAKKEEAKRLVPSRGIAKTFESTLKTWPLYLDTMCLVVFSLAYESMEITTAQYRGRRPDIRKKNRLFRGPTHAALVPAVAINSGVSQFLGPPERCDVLWSTENHFILQYLKHCCDWVWGLVPFAMLFLSAKKLLSLIHRVSISLAKVFSSDVLLSMLFDNSAVASSLL